MSSSPPRLKISEDFLRAKKEPRNVRAVLCQPMKAEIGPRTEEMFYRDIFTDNFVTMKTLKSPPLQFPANDGGILHICPGNMCPDKLRCQR